MQIECNYNGEIDILKKSDMLDDLCEMAVRLNKSIIPFSLKDGFYSQYHSSGINYAVVKWPWKVLNELDSEGKIEILDEFAKYVRISDEVLIEYKAKKI